MSLDVMPDIEGALRLWFRSHAALTAIVSGRTFFGTPDDADESDYPMIKIARVGGGDDVSEAPIDVAQIQFNCEGPLRRKDTALALKNTVRSVLRSVRSPTTIPGSVVLYGAEVTSDVWLPDPADDRPRYILTATVTSRAA